MKIIAVDLDGTLLNNRSDVSTENLDAIKVLSKKGIQTAILTGRTFYEIPKKLRDCNNIEYYVYSNGAGINEGDTNISFSPIDKAMSKKVYSILNEYATFTEVYTNGKPHIEADKFTYDILDDYKIDRAFIPVIEATRFPVDSLEDLVNDEENEIEMFDVFFKHESERQECKNRIEAEFGLGITTSMDNNLEIIASGINKGAGLLKLCDVANITLDDIVVIGDSLNDMTAFTTAKHKYAVSNACDEIKALATKIICSNEEHIMVYMQNELLN